MTWFDEVKPAFLVIKAFGLLPYTFVAGIPVKSKSWKIWVCINLVAYLSSSFTLYAVKSVTSTKWNTLYKTLALIWGLCNTFTFATHSATVLCSIDKLKTAFYLINEYDRTLRINFTTEWLVVQIWVIFSLPTIAFIYLQISQLLNQPILVTVMRVQLLLAYTASHLAMFYFVTLINSIKRRLKHLHRVITADAEYIMYDRNDGFRPLRLIDTCRLHDTLISAAKILNLIYNLYLLFWIVECCTFMTFRVHDLIVADRQMDSLILWNSTKEIFNIANLLYLFVSCHNTNVAANKVGLAALSPRSCVLHKRFRFERDEGFIIGQHFALQPFHFTAGYGLFVIELSFLGSITGAIATVLVILSA